MPVDDSTTSGVQYREIEGFPDYRVGDDGSIWSRRSAADWRRLKPHPQSRGHCTVDLGRRKTRFVHRLVLEAFVGSCPSGMECRHLDGDPSNNRLDNLAWGTRLENYQDSVKHGTAYLGSEESIARIKADPPWQFVRHKSGEKHHRAKLTDEQVETVRQTVKIVPGKRSKEAAELAKMLNVSYNAIRLIAKGMRRRSGT